jgi:hypothetical protein
MKYHSVKILLIISFSTFLFLFPYTKIIKKFKAEDVNWDIINTSKQYKEFDPSLFTLKKTYYFSPEIQKLNHSVISIKGFIKNEKHGNHKDLILTESVTDVCFMCDHDKTFRFIKLIPAKPESDLFKIKNDTYVHVEGIFSINKNDKVHAVFMLENASLIQIINP